MKLTFKTKKLETECNDFTKATRNHGDRLIVEPILDENKQTIGVNVVKLLEVTDYHGN